MSADIKEMLKTLEKVEQKQKDGDMNTVKKYLTLLKGQYFEELHSIKLQLEHYEKSLDRCEFRSAKNEFDAKAFDMTVELLKELRKMMKKVV